MKKLILLLLLTNTLFANALTNNQIDARIKKVNGDATEYLMNKTFKQNGWKQIQGEVGDNGIDGLYVKRNTKGTVTNVMFGEAKYNTSKLGKNYYGTDIKNIKQMSKTALNNQIDNLIKKYPNDKQYIQVKQHLNNGSYRARIFQLKKDGNFLIPEIKSINHNGDIDVQKTKLIGNQNYKINNTRININNPKNSFETRFVENYKRGQKVGLMRKFNFSAIDSQNVFKKSPFLNTQHVRDQISISENMKTNVSKSFNKSAITINNTKMIKHLKIKTVSFWKKVAKKSLKVIRKVK